MGAGESRADLPREDPGQIVVVGTGKAEEEELDPILKQLMAIRSVHAAPAVTLNELLRNAC